MSADGTIFAQHLTSFAHTPKALFGSQIFEKSLEDFSLINLD